MILWTIQSPAAVAALEREGILVANSGMPDPLYRPAFQWMARQMSQRLGSRPRHSRPLWARRVWDSSHPRPDLRQSGHLPPGQRGARIEFVADPACVLLSDFDLWHYVLNYWYLPTSTRDDAAFEALVMAAGLSFDMKPLPDSHLHSRIEASWDRIFDLNTFIKDITRRRAKRSIQATFWSLPMNAVRDVTWFTAR